jgi:hypothetical protein
MCESDKAMNYEYSSFSLPCLIKPVPTPPVLRQKSVCPIWFSKKPGSFRIQMSNTGLWYLENSLLAVPWENLSGDLVLLVTPELFALELNL